MRKILVGPAFALSAAIAWVGSSVATPQGNGSVTDQSAQNAAAIKVAAATPAHPANWVSTLPPSKGSARDGSLSYPSRAKEVQGSIGRLEGAVRVYSISKSTYRQGADSVLEISVESGKVRAYLEYFPDTGSFFRHQDGYLFAEATPDAPAKVEGFLSLSPGSGATDTYAVTFESIAGEAMGIRYRITPRR
jgi:hypothetical protein